jgi:hypothetical protein
MVEPWAKARGWAIETLKQVVLEDVFGRLEVVHGRTGVVFHVLAEPHTSRLSKEQFSFLITRSVELAAEDGVVLVAPDEFNRPRG